MISMQRPLIKQEGTTFSVVVGTTGTPINPNMGITSMVDSFLVSVPLTAANSIFLGFDAGVTVATGLEILAGTAQNFVIDHEGRQLYELQGLLADLTVSQVCRQLQLDAIPFVVWDMSQIYLVAAAATTISVGVFKAVYI